MVYEHYFIDERGIYDMGQQERDQDMNVTDEMVEAGAIGLAPARSQAMSELKPCPFCGGEAFPSKHFWHVIVCKDCGAEGPPAVRLSDDGEEDTEAKAITAWNTRAPDTAGLREAVEIVERYAAQLEKHHTTGPSFVRQAADLIETRIKETECGE